jgi:hypothetical protein
VTTSIVVCSILFSSNKLFWVEELTISTGADFIDYSGFKIDKDCTRNMFARTSFGKESVKRVISVVFSSNGSVRSDTMF